jgi:hypothetical protein
MTPKYLIQDDQGNSGTYVPCTQGETKNLSLYLRNRDDSPLLISEDITEIVAKIYTGVSTSAIQKKLSTETLTKITQDSPSGCIGFEFSLSPSDTTSIVANSSGIPMLITVTLANGDVIEYNFLETLLVDVPVVQS